MAEYIEREASCKDCSHYPVCEDKLFGSNHKNCRHFQNKADVVEVVRCKDCIYANDDGTICRYNVGRSTKPNGYCNNGERRGVDDG